MQKQPDALMYRILTKVEEANRVASHLIAYEHGVFAPVSLGMPRLEPAELGFIRSVSLAYVLYFEAGKIGVAFLAEKFSAYSLDADGALAEHFSLVQELRTFTQHNLNPTKPHDKEIQEDCESWLERYSATPIPSGEDHWRMCLVGLLVEMEAFVEALVTVVRSIEKDEAREQICDSWQFRLDRYHPPHQFDALIQKIATDIGRDGLDVVRFRQRNYDSWTKSLFLLQANYEFETEARRLIEQALLNEAVSVLPVTGADIMEFFKIGPGSRVGAILGKARELYAQSPCGRGELLSRLTAEISIDEAHGFAESSNS